MEVGKFNILCDAYWGSSAKAAASTRLADIYNVKHFSTNNFPNAGHSVIKGTDKWVAKALPSPASLHRHFPDRFADAQAFIGPASGFELNQFASEVEYTGLPRENIHVHERAVIVGERHKLAEAGGGSASVLAISSTMSGSGAALTEKAMRQPTTETVRNSNVNELAVLHQPSNFSQRVYQELKDGHTFLHEVSQGYALSLNHGTHYPQCTSRDCTPQQAISDMQIRPKEIGSIYLNLRSFPIRVGNNFDDTGKQVGYSGDGMPDQQETSWEEVGHNAEMPAGVIAQLAQNEKTTVTKKVRRVFTTSWDLLRMAATHTGATHLILNFPQYIHWSSYGLRGGPEMKKELHPKVRAYIDQCEETTNLPVVMLGTGAEHSQYVWMV